MKKEKRGKEPNKGVGVVGPTPTKAIFAGGQIIQIWPQSVPLLLLFPFQLTHTTVSIDDRRGRGPSQSSGPFSRDRELDGKPTRLKTKYKTKLPTNPTQSSHK